MHRRDREPQKGETPQPALGPALSYGFHGSFPSSAQFFFLAFSNQQREPHTQPSVVCRQERYTVEGILPHPPL